MVLHGRVLTEYCRNSGGGLCVLKLDYSKRFQRGRGLPQGAWSVNRIKILNIPGFHISPSNTVKNGKYHIHCKKQQSKSYTRRHHGNRVSSHASSSGRLAFSQLTGNDVTPPGPVASESLRARSVAPPTSRPGPRHQRRRGNDAGPLPVSLAPWQQEAPPLAASSSSWAE